MLTRNFRWLGALIVLVGLVTYLQGTPPLLPPTDGEALSTNQAPSTQAPPIADPAERVSIPDADLAPPLLPPLAEGPPADLPPVPPPPQPSADEDTIQQLLQLRKQIGSPLKGTALEDAGGDSFADFLRRAITLDPPQAQQPAEYVQPLEEPMQLEAPTIETGLMVVEQLRAAASALEQHSDQLQSTLPARSRRLRALAGQLRQESDEIRELGH